MSILREMTLPILIFIVFITLKLMGEIDWSWVWVTSPLWIGAGLQIIAKTVKS
jgi:hypothetical protein